MSNEHHPINQTIAQTAIGPQYLIGGFESVSLRQRLEFLASLPLQPKQAKVQKPCDIGLFDEVARNQLEMF